MKEKELNIYQTITNIIEDIPAIGKNKKNSTQGFMFRGIDDVMNAIQPLFAKHKLFIVPEILEQIREERQTKNGGNLIYSVCKIRYTFYAGDGSSIQAVVVGEGMDSGDKATNKAMAIAMKYVLFQVFCIPTLEMKDPDEETHELEARRNTTPIQSMQEMYITTIQKENIKERFTIEEIKDILQEKNVSKLSELSYSDAYIMLSEKDRIEKEVF